MISVETTGDDVCITIRNNSIPVQRLNVLLDWLRMEEAVQHSQLTEDDADRIADEIKAGWWKANKSRFLPASAE